MKSEYPKPMYHPNFKPAVLSAGAAMDTPGGPGQGRSAVLPPMVVSSPAEEQYHASRGYLPGSVAHPEPVPLRHKERDNIRMRQAPEPEVPETYEYPKWVGDKIARSAEEEAALLDAMNSATLPEPANEPPAQSYVDAAELAEFRAWKAAQNTVEWEQFKNWKVVKEFDKDWETNQVRLAQGVSDAQYKPKRQPLTEEQKQQRRDNLATARAVRRKNLEAARAS